MVEVRQDGKGPALLRARPADSPAECVAHQLFQRPVLGVGAGLVGGTAEDGDAHRPARVGRAGQCGVAAVTSHRPCTAPCATASPPSATATTAACTGTALAVAVALAVALALALAL